MEETRELHQPAPELQQPLRSTKRTTRLTKHRTSRPRAAPYARTCTSCLNRRLREVNADFAAYYRASSTTASSMADVRRENSVLSSIVRRSRILKRQMMAESQRLIAMNRWLKVEVRKQFLADKLLVNNAKSMLIQNRVWNDKNREKMEELMNEGQMRFG